MEPLDKLIEGIQKATELPRSKYNYQCPHLDYGKSADKALGAYCLLKKTCVEDCEGCVPFEEEENEKPNEANDI